MPGTKLDAIDFDDLESEKDGFTLNKSNAQQRRANELLGILSTRDPKVSYVTWGPKFLVRTSHAGDMKPMMKWTMALLTPLIGEEPDKAIQSTIALIADPPGGRTAHRGFKKVSVNQGPDDERDVNRLAAAIDSYTTTLGISATGTPRLGANFTD
ncbi:hypothetical protein ACIQ6K_35635 [Streptomyces sp. NPDC096354]|uniref:hypothetical protein n=1 Tax=Streptomyces sp. NPDC096354 TaxID=3366088 RepID=UPI0038274C25